MYKVANYNIKVTSRVVIESVGIDHSEYSDIQITTETQVFIEPIDEHIPGIHIILQCPFQTVWIQIQTLQAQNEIVLKRKTNKYPTWKQYISITIYFLLIGRFYMEAI